MKRSLTVLCCLGLYCCSLKADCLNNLSYLRECLAVRDQPYLEKAHYRYIISGRRETKGMLVEFPKYEGLIREVLATEGLPDWLCYLPLAESRLKLNAISSAGAVGLWQIMPATGRSLGLRINSQIDERLDVVKSTRAAAAYLKAMHERFGDWLLALAAYNCGPGNVRKAQRRAKGYFYHEISRYLPSQTRRYLPRVLTISHIAQSPLAYDFKLEQKKLPLRVIKVYQSTHLRTIASYYQLSKHELYRLNPTYRNGKIRLDDEPALVYLPVRLGEPIAASLSPMVISQHLELKTDHLPVWQQFTGLGNGHKQKNWWKLLVGQV